MGLEKAIIDIIIGSKSSEEDRVEVLFNPTEYSLESSNKYSWQSIPGASQPIAQFVSGEATTLTMELFFDSYEKSEDVRKYTMKIVRLLDVNKDLHAPPLCKFMWGSLTFVGIVERINQRYTMFNTDGVPVRARLDVTFKSVKTMKEQLQEIPRQSADRTKQRTLKQGEQLWQIAAEEYEDAALWRAIARANGITDPRQLEAGAVIKIPRLYG